MPVLTDLAYEISTMIEKDRERLSEELGMEITRSEYHRLVIMERVKGPMRAPWADGYAEGVRAGSAEIMEEFRVVMKRLMLAAHGREPG